MHQDAGHGRPGRAFVRDNDYIWAQSLRMLRGTRFWTREQMAMQLRVDTAVLRAWEAGLAIPDIRIQIMIRDLLGRPVEGTSLRDLLKHSNTCRHLFRTDLPVKTGKPSRILEISDALSREQPLGRDVFFRPRNAHEVELTRESDEMLHRCGRFYGGEMVMATMRTIWLQLLPGGMSVRHAISRWVPMRLEDGTPVCLYERRSVTPSAFISLPALPTFMPLDEMIN